MATATADASASIRIETPNYSRAPSQHAAIVERYMRMFALSRLEQLDARAKVDPSILVPVQPEWLSTVQSRINKSIVPGGLVENDGRWLSQQTAVAAIDFFNATADLLPGEPFIYSSLEGDLIAEFTGERGVLTAIISPNFTVLFAASQAENPIRKVVSSDEKIREEVDGIVSRLGK